jgi:hypothetical protein
MAALLYEQQSVPWAKLNALAPLDTEQPPRNCGVVVSSPQPDRVHAPPLGQTSIDPPRQEFDPAVALTVQALFGPPT